ncbi:hypothetical protein AB7Z98_14080 [Providencia manganoxydans]
MKRARTFTVEFAHLEPQRPYGKERVDLRLRLPTGNGLMPEL